MEYHVGQKVKIAWCQAADIKGYNREGVIASIRPYGEYTVDSTDRLLEIKDMVVGEEDIAPLDAANAEDAFPPAKSVGSAQNLPALTGSEKQSQWAHGLRVDALNAVAVEVMDLEKQANDETTPAAAKPIVEQLVAGYAWFFQEAHTDASWWINNRKGNHHDWVRLVASDVEAYMAAHCEGYDVLFHESRGWQPRPKRRAK